MIDKNKKYRTRSGRDVRIYATDGGGPHPVHGAILEDGMWSHETWKKDGIYSASLEESLSLVEVKPRIKVSGWVNVYKDSFITYNSKEGADACRLDGWLACVKITIDCEEGEGL